MLDIDGWRFAGGVETGNHAIDPLPIGGRVKRIFDVVMAASALLSMSLLLIVIIVAIRLSSRGPAIYAHHRVGYGGRIFPCLKFRTMVVDADERLDQLLKSDPQARYEFEHYRKLKHDPRIIPGIGSFLRTTSLDELPQLVNVLLGHMSIVGPRPITDEELRRYGGAIESYLSSRPGITGLWQVSGRNDISFEERAIIDQRYVFTWAFHRDLRIILRTFAVLALRRGAY